MNYSGSYRKLLGNAKSAILAAVEIYNKPIMAYRDEIFVILLINAWELMLKAIVSKARKSIFYKKKRNQPYKTLSWGDAMSAASGTTLWPSDIPSAAVRANLRFIALYRDHAVHFYNDSDFSTLMYSFAQTSISNFRELGVEVFGDDLAEDITWQLLPLGIEAPVDPVDFLRRPESRTGRKASRAVEELVAELHSEEKALAEAGIDTGRLLTIYSVSLQSRKKIGDADVVVAVDNTGDTESILVPKKSDPNTTHPYLQRDIIRKVKEKRPTFNSRSFQAVLFVKRLREDTRYCWHNRATENFQWSPETLTLISRLSDAEIAAARSAYSQELARRRVSTSVKPSTD